VAIGAFHSPLSKVNVRFDFFVFSQILVPYPTSVASGAVTRHGGRFHKIMPVYKTAARNPRLTHMTIAASGMARLTMVVKHFVNFRMVFRRDTARG
jgi:hypothetical protein